MLLIILFLPSTILNNCIDYPKCFKKRFFKFDMPDDGLYNISVGITNQYKTILGYGDFNNDLFNDLVLAK